LAHLGELTVLGRDQLDLTAPDLEGRLEKLAPVGLGAIVNAAAYTKVDLAETEREPASLANALAPGILATFAEKRGALFIHYSSDYVYPGDKESPYEENDPTGPLNWYGETKLAGDRAVMATDAQWVILRTSWVYGLGGNNFPHTILRAAEYTLRLDMDQSQRGSPTSTELLAAVTAHILGGAVSYGKAPKGLFHLCPRGDCTWLEFSRFLVGEALALGMRLTLTPDGIKGREGPDRSRAATRPLNSRLSVRSIEESFGITLPHWKHHARRFVRACRDLKKTL
jgi:dTDP-4-dehydrorhamnose reductase